MRSRRLAALILVVAACSEGEKDSTVSQEIPRIGAPVDLTGAGATFPFPLYSRWITDYSARTGVRINYQSIGSGGGIQQLSERAVDFGASDVPMTDGELARVKGQILHVPMVAGAIAIVYSVPGIPAGLRLDGPLLSDIYLGRVVTWNDPRIVEMNNGMALPAVSIVVVHRSDPSGATYVFTDYLSAVSLSWKRMRGRGKEIQWSIGAGENGNEGVAGRVKQSPGAIGYVEFAYAKQNRLPVAAIRNSSDRYVLPSHASVAAAAGSVPRASFDSSDFRISIVNAATADAYPISSFTWILFYRNQPDAVKGRKLMDFLRWALTDGAPDATALDYAPLPSELAAKVRASLRFTSLALPAAGHSEGSEKRP